MIVNVDLEVSVKKTARHQQSQQQKKDYCREFSGLVWQSQSSGSQKRFGVQTGQKYPLCFSKWSLFYLGAHCWSTSAFPVTLLAWFLSVSCRTLLWVYPARDILPWPQVAGKQLFQIQKYILHLHFALPLDGWKQQYRSATPARACVKS